MATVHEVTKSKGIATVITEQGTKIRIRQKHFDKYPVSAGDEIKKEYLYRLAAVQADDCYEFALTLLDYSAKTAYEMRKKLINSGYVQPAADAAVQRLKEAGLINDALIAEKIAGNSNNGIFNIKRKLTGKGISEEDAETALNAITDEMQLGSAQKLISKLERKYRELPSREQRSKLSQALARRGFSWDIISQALDDHFDR